MERERDFYRLSFNNSGKSCLGGGKRWWKAGAGGQDGGRITELVALQGLAHLNSVGDGAGAAEVTISQVPAGMHLICTPQNVGCKREKPVIGH